MTAELDFLISVPPGSMAGPGQLPPAVHLPPPANSSLHRSEPADRPDHCARPQLTRPGDPEPEGGGLAGMGTRAPALATLRTWVIPGNSPAGVGPAGGPPADGPARESKLIARPRDLVSKPGPDACKLNRARAWPLP